MGSEPRIIAIINLKGGTGKTTSAVYMATVLVKGGSKAVVVDADSEQSALNWGQDNSLPFPVVLADKDRLGKQVRELAAAGNVVLIDCAPNNRDTLFSAALAADKIIVPVAPTGQDVNRLVATLNILVEVEESRDADLAHILVTRWDSRRILAKEFVDMFKDYPVLENKISNRAIYQKEFGIEPTFLDEYSAVVKEVMNSVT